MIALDKKAYSSPIRFQSPFLKSFFAIATLLCVVIGDSLCFSILVFIIMGGAALCFSSASFSYYCKLFVMPLPFLLLSIMAIIVSIGKEPLDFLTISVGSAYLTVGKKELLEGSEIFFKSMASISCLYFLILTTPIMDFFEVLRKLKVPEIMIELMLLIYRFIFVIIENGKAIITAQSCRMGHKNARISVKSMGQMLSVLLIHSYKRTDMLYNAMEARSYTGKMQMLTNLKKASKKQIAFVGITESVLILLAILFTVRGY